jgi:DNA polymerase III delta prime subunit
MHTLEIPRTFDQEHPLRLTDFELYWPEQTDYAVIYYFWDFGEDLYTWSELDYQVYHLLRPAAPYVGRRARRRRNRLQAGPPDEERFGGVVIRKTKNFTNSPQWRQLLDANAPHPSWNFPLRARYTEQFSSALNLEKVQSDNDMGIFNLRHVLIQNVRRGVYRIEVPGLLEKRPSILANDVVYAWRPHTNQEYGGRVIEVQQRTILVRFRQNFAAIANHILNVRFVPSDPALKRMLAALNYCNGNGAIRELVFQRLFPEATQQQRIEPLNLQIVPIQRQLNHCQEHAVRAILANVGQPRLSPYIIFGPPGTGKTFTVTECILQLCQKIPDVRILVCTASNAAADVVAHRLLLQNPELSLARLLSFQRHNALGNLNTIELNAIRNKCVLTLNNDRNQIVVSTCSAAWTMPLDYAKFDYLFIDEAGQAMEPELLIPLSIAIEANPKVQLILAGDPQQLGPVIRCKIPTNPLSISLLERLSRDPLYSRQNQHEQHGYYDPVFITKLVENYRSDFRILTEPSRMFYNNELIARAPESPFLGWERLINPCVPIIFHSIISVEEREDRSPSYFNRGEAIKVIDVLEQICTAFPGKSIGIITPYHQQKQKIRRYFEEKARTVVEFRNIQDFHVGSVEEFQGSERDVIIISTVRSRMEMNSTVLGSLGFLTCPNRLNVSITRPKELLVFVGNAGLLSLDPNWQQIVNHCRQIGALEGPIWNYDPPPAGAPELPPDNGPEDFAGPNAEI